MPVRQATTATAPTAGSAPAATPTATVTARSWRWLLLLPLLLVVPLVPMLDDIDGPGRADPPALVAFAPPAGPRTTGPLSMIFVADRSGSIEEADPHHVLAGELSLLIEWFTRWGRPEDRIGVVVHTERARTVLDLTAVASGVTVPTGLPSNAELGGGTAFTDATNVADTMLQDPANGSSRAIVVYITDGAGEDIAAAAVELTGGIDVYVMGLDGGGLWAERKAEWNAAFAPTDTWSIGRLHPGDLAEPFAALMSDVTGQDVTTHETVREAT